MKKEMSAEFGTIENVKFLYDSCLEATNYKFSKMFLMLLITATSQNKSNALDITSLVAICALYLTLKSRHGGNPLDENHIIKTITTTTKCVYDCGEDCIYISNIYFSSSDKNIKIKMISKYNSIMIILPNNKILVYRDNTFIFKKSSFLNSILTALEFNKELQNERL
jgi:hypothetical protein